MGMYGGGARQHALQQPAVILRRVQRRMARYDAAAEIGVAADLGALLAARHRMALDAEFAPVGLEFARHLLVMARRMGADEAAAVFVIAIDSLFRDEAGEEVERGERLPVQGHRARLAVARREIVEAGLEAGAALAAVARAATEAGVLGVEHGDAAPGPRHRQRRDQPGVARADDDDIGLRRRIGGRQGGERRVIKPVGRELVIGGEQGVDHCMARHTRSAVSGMSIWRRP